MDVPVPEYPANSRRKAEQGVVLLEVEVLPDGHAGAISVVEDGGLTQLSKAATEAARRGRYRPAMVGGVAVRSVIRLPFRFVLE
jgi:protein TonB